MISVVVPTHNRVDMVVKVAKALDCQETSADVELIFALDGCSDGTKQALQSLYINKSIKLIEIDGLGAATARNRGASIADGGILLFIDDDIIPQPGMIEAHNIRHLSTKRIAVTGSCPYAPELPVNALDFYARDWWHNKYRSMSDPTHIFTYEDCLTGNLSISKDDFMQIGGFDEAFKKDGREDYEFGVRLLSEGIQLTFAPDAVSYHYPASSPKSLLRKRFTFGRADIYFGNKHPEIIDGLPLRKYLPKSKKQYAVLRFAALLSRMNPEYIISILGSYFDRNTDHLWDSRLLSVWNRCLHLSYFLGAVSASGSYTGFANLMHKWYDPENHAATRIKLIDIDLTAPLNQINGLHRYDKLLILHRIRNLVTGWLEYDCDPSKESLASEDLAEFLADSICWDAWVESSTRNTLYPSRQEADTYALRSINQAIDNILDQQIKVLADNYMQPPDITPSAIIFADTASKACNTVKDEALFKQSVFVTASDNILYSKVDIALGAIKSDGPIAILRNTDTVDDYWITRAMSHFNDPETTCVITPVINRDIHSKADELYSWFVDINRIKGWKHCSINDWIHPGNILNYFQLHCHRILISKHVLIDALSSLGHKYSTIEEIETGVFASIIRNYKKIIYDPRAVIWTDQRLDISGIKMMISESAYTRNIVAARIFKSAKTGRFRAIKMIEKLLRNQTRNLMLSLTGKSAWPAEIVLSEFTSGLRGLRHGLRTSINEPIHDTSPVVLEEEGVIWVS